MMNTLTSRLFNAGLIAAVAVLAPSAAFAQDAAMDNSSPTIGLLVVWLLGVGGLLSVVAGVAMDKSAQATRTTRR